MDLDPYNPTCAKCGQPVDWEYRTQSYVHKHYEEAHAATLHGERSW